MLDLLADPTAVFRFHGHLYIHFHNNQDLPLAGDGSNRQALGAKVGKSV